MTLLHAAVVLGERKGEPEEEGRETIQRDGTLRRTSIFDVQASN